VADESKPKYQHIFEQLSRQILTGHYKAGQKFPSEAALVQRFGASRITVGRALRELQQRGLIDRIAGSGTYVRAGAARSALLFGLVIPDLGETEIFEPICQGIANSPAAAAHALLWAHADISTESRADQALELCHHCIERSVSGVFFAPLELIPGASKVNRMILRMLKEAGIPVVLLDRRAEEPSARGRCDLVGIDNHRAGFLATEHLITLGARQITFMSFENQATTVTGRIAGYRDALTAHGIMPAGELMFSGLPGEELDLRFTRGAYDALVCANDRIAGALMHTLLGQGVRIPEDVRIVGIDDVTYAALLPVPLTTIHQPCRSIGEVALRVMLDRLDQPKLPARNVFLDCSLVVRQSCGASRA
jgi:DNA-binding LacI/PurR family transcriptional regulator